MNILITGSDGFVGRHFVKALHGEHTITYIDKRSTTTCQKYFNGIMSDYPFDLVIHCAAMVGGRAKIDGDPLAIAENLAIDSDLFRWVIRRKIPRVVYFSSSAAYPTWMQASVRDAMRLWEGDINLGLKDVGAPDQTYGWAKLTGELLAQHAQAAGSRVHVFRPFSGYGEDQDLDYPFPSFIQRAKDRDDPFEIWGDGTQTRDFIHIDDIVGAVLKAIDEDITDPVNLGWGRPTSFNELAELVTGAAGYEPEIRHLTDKPVGCMYRVANAEKMKSFYTPKVTLEEGIERALDA
ncbi:MAG: NAD-dependent epimerase/dehydratase family protein [Actinobacteria bacterium]|nr:NAD-dependent epimerase/dehydratase family protein [Actinomycetota bacterium]